MPRLIVFVAPAGFGKTTAALQFASRAATAVICDCTNATTELQLAAEIIAALARESPDKTAFLIGCELNMTAGAAAVDQQLALVLSAWRYPSKAASFIVENAERLLSIPGAIRLFSQLLASLPDERTLILCSRVALPLHFGRFVPLERIAVITAADLAFSADEVAELCRLAGVHDEPTVVRTAENSRGWPMAVMALLRIAVEKGHASILDRLEDIAIEDLHDYCVTEVLASLAPAVHDVLIACALLPAPTEEDVADALGDAGGPQLSGVIAATPFLGRSPDNRLDVHPLVRGALLQLYSARRDDTLSRVAVRRMAQSRFIEAAQLQLARGDHLAAALALDRINWLETPSTTIESARVLASIDRDVIMRFPKLWALTILYGRFSLDPHVAVGEAQALLQTMDAQTPIPIRSYVIRPLASYLSRLGMHDLGYRMIRDFERETAIPESPQTFDQAAVVYIRAMIAGRCGRVREFEEQAARAWPFAAKHDAMRTLLQVERAAEILRPTSRRVEEVFALDDAIARAERHNIAVNLGFALAEATFGAWFIGDDAAFLNHLERLEDAVERLGVRGFAYFVACARGRLGIAPQRNEFPKWLACAHLVAIPALAHPGARAARAAAALSAAEEYAAPFTLILALIAVAETIPERRTDTFARAIDLVGRIESPALQAALNAYVSGETDMGMLSAVVARLRTEDMAPAILVELLNGSVSCAGNRLRLSEGNLQFVFALARQRKPLSRGELIELLWPNGDEKTVGNAFNMCIHHVRRRLGEQAVVRTGNGYRLGENVRVDIAEIEHEFAAVPPERRLDPVEAIKLQAMHRRLCVPHPSPVREWEWFAPTLRRIEGLRCQLADRLARDALAGGHPRLALELARDVIVYDEWDEPARELVIRAYLALGDQAQALREFRLYQAILARELGARPSFSLEQLVAGSTFVLSPQSLQNDN